MFENEELIEGQLEVGQSIIKIGVNFGKDSETRKDEAYLLKRIELLEKYWIDFQGRHAKINTDLEHDYFKKDYFGSIKKKYLEIKESLQSKYKDIRAQSVIASTSSGSASEIDIEQQRRFKKQKMWTESIYATIDKLNDGQFVGKPSSYISQLIKGLNNYWDLIVANHAELASYSSDKEILTIDYWKESTFEILEGMYVECISKLQEQLLSDNLSTRQVSPSIAHNNNDYGEMNLPKIQIPCFSGNYASWVSFNDLFTQTIHCNTKLGNAQKMHYLKTLVNGEALSLIKHLPVTSENYQPAWKLLEARYNNERLLVNTHLKTILNQAVITTESSYQIKRLHDTTVEAVNALKQLKINIESWDPILIYIVSQKLDKETMKLHEQQMKNPKKLESLHEFMEFLEMRFHALDTVKTNIKVNSTSVSGTSSYWKPQGNNKPKVISHHTTIDKRCYVCQGDHKLLNCEIFNKAEARERMDVVKRNQLCWNCYGKHKGRCNRNGSCAKCRGKHQTALHEFMVAQKPTNEQSKADLQPASLHLCAHNRQDNYKTTLLATALVETTNKFGSIVTLRALIDQGSQASFITEDAVQHIGLKKKKCFAKISGLGSENFMQSSGIVTVKLRPIHQSKFEINVDALVVNRVTHILPNNSFKADWEHIRDLPLADPGFHKSGKIDLLLGAEMFSEIILSGVIKGKSNAPIAQQTELGWILSGTVSLSSKINEITVSSMIMQVDRDDQLQKFWEIEEVLDVKTALTDEEVACETQYENTTKRRADGRYIVNLPKQNIELGQSRKMAIATLLQMEKRFEINPGFKQKYVDFMNEYKVLGHMEEVYSMPHNNDTKIINYLPHHAVIKEDSSTTKLRVVFDGSRKTSNKISLNGILLTGPKLQDDLITIILRWRRYKIVMTADIEKMYRQILVSDEDKDLQRIVWREAPDSRIKDYKLATLTYGTTSAPYLAIKTLQKLATDDKDLYPIGSKIALRDFYVDDLLTGANSMDEATAIQREIIDLLKGGGFKLRKWSSNKEEILKEIDDCDREINLPFNIHQDDNIKTLGLYWNPANDSFGIKTAIFNTASESNGIITKRKFLSEISTLFDPLGWFSPVIIKTKILLQHIWSSGITWDQKIPSEIFEIWVRIKGELPELQQLRINRWIQYNTGTIIELHGFCDASEQAYAAVIYTKCKQPDGNNEITLIASKTKVAPLKKVTLPRLELSAALLLAKLMSRVVESMELQDCNKFLWTDSMVTLSWIKGHPHKWKNFVANRVSQIQNLSNPISWYHVKSKENPADVASRGIYPSELVSNTLWWNGPIFLKTFTRPNTNHFIANTDLEQKKVKIFMTINHEEKLHIIHRFSSLTKLVRTIAYSLRFIHNIRNKNSRINGPLSVKDLEVALQKVIEIVQKIEFCNEINKLKMRNNLDSKSKLLALNPFIDATGILRVGGRLRKSNLHYNEKHPIILPKSNHLTNLLIQNAHLTTLHGGTQHTIEYLRQKYWIINARNEVRKSIYKCVICHRHKREITQQLMGNLPEPRVNVSRPFTNVGIDYAGPYDVRLSKGRGTKSYKGYVAIFICFCTKAIHIEFVSDLTSQAFLAALKRFIGRRGMPAKIYSDNGTNFVGAEKILRNVVKMLSSTDELCNWATNKGIDWKFIPPSSPHFGGLWEAGVKSIKYHLKRIVGTHTFTYEEMSTVLIQIEAVLNSRPLTALTSDPDDTRALTPGHFLIGSSLISPPEQSLVDFNTNHLTRWKLVQAVYQNFWKRWSREFLSRLQQRPKWNKKFENLKIGQLVLLREDNLPPTKWVLGRIKEVHPGTDGLVRVVTIKTSKTTIKRPISKISPLPIEDKTEEKEIDNIANESVIENPDPQLSQPNVTKYRKYPKMGKAGMPMIFLLTTISILCCSIVATTTRNLELPYKLDAFKSKPGIYFEEAGTAHLINAHWNIVAYYNLSNYWLEQMGLEKCMVKIETLCDQYSQLVDISYCSNLIIQFNHQRDTIYQFNELIFGSTNIKTGPKKTERRRKRGLLNVFGNVANELFGVLDNRFADQYARDIKRVNENENYILQLMKNQTSIAETTENIIKKSSSEVLTQFSNLCKQLEQIEIKLRNQESIDHSLSSISFETLLIIINHQKIQETLLDIILDQHQGRTNPSVITPDQLDEQIELIQSALSPNLALPSNNIKEVYQLMEIQAAINHDQVIFRIIVPLINPDYFQLFKITPTPIAINETKYLWINPSTDYIIINLRRDLYYPIMKDGIAKCMTLRNNEYFCEQRHAIYNLDSSMSQCEISFMIHKDPLDFCQIIETKQSAVWIPLLNSNQWIYVLDHPYIVDIICGKTVTNVKLDDSGIITLKPGCELKQPSMFLIAIDNIVSNVSASFTPLINIEDKLRERNYDYNLSSTADFNIYNQDDMDRLTKMIIKQKSDLELFNEVSTHDIHQYVIAYIGLVAVLIVVIYLIMKRVCKRKPVNEAPMREVVVPDEFNMEPVRPSVISYHRSAPRREMGVHDELNMEQVRPSAIDRFVVE